MRQTFGIGQTHKEDLELPIGRFQTINRSRTYNHAPHGLIWDGRRKWLCVQLYVVARLMQPTQMVRPLTYGLCTATISRLLIESRINSISGPG